MRISISSPIPDLGSKPGPGRPGWGPAGSYDFQFEVSQGQVAIQAIPRVNGLKFTIKWQDGTEQPITSAQLNLQSPTTDAGIISINQKSGDTTWCDDFKVVSGQSLVTKVISWGENPWNKLVAAFDGCANLTSISKTSLITDSTGNLQAIFRDCTGLTEAVCKNWDLSAGSTIADIFEGCTNLTKLDFTGVNIKISSSSARAFKSVGNTTTDGCEFLFSGLNLSTWSYTGTQNFEWFSSTKIKPTSTFANWSFNPSVGPNGMTQLFTSATITGTNSTLDISGWSSYSGNSMSQWFQNFNAWNVVGNTGAKINLTNLGTTNVNSMYFFGWKSGVTELTGLSTLGANTGNTGTIQMESAFRELRFLKLSGSNNFGNTFTSSIKPITFKSTFRDSGAGLTSDYSEAPIFSNMDASSCLTFQNMLQGTKLATMPDFDTVTFPTTAVSFAASFSAITATSYSGSHLDLSNATLKPSTFNGLLSGSNIEKVTFGNNVDLSGCTDFTSLAFNGGSTAQPMEIILPTNADYSSATSFNTSFQGLDGPSAGNPPLTTCVADTLIRRLFATNLNGALTLNLESSKITEAPSVVQSQLDQLRTAGWNITDNSTDATLPFAYPSYLFDSNLVQSVTPTTVPTGGQFSTTSSGVNVNSSTGEVTWSAGVFAAATIKCTYTDGCYNEVEMFIVDTVSNSYSMKFDGALDTSFYFENTSIAVGEPWTMSFWFKRNGTPSPRERFLGGDPSTTTWFSYQEVQTDGTIGMRNINGNLWPWTNTNVCDNQWHHIVLQRQPYTPANNYLVMRSYVDGVLDRTSEINDWRYKGTLYNGPLQFIGSGNPLAQSFTGYMDEFAAWNSTLTQQEITLIYQAASANKMANLSSLPTQPDVWFRLGD